MKLYRNVWDMLRLGTRGGLNFDKIECSVAIPIEDIYSYLNLLESERPFK